jgi:hypothetical protein
MVDERRFQRFDKEAIYSKQIKVLLQSLAFDRFWKLLRICITSDVTNLSGSQFSLGTQRVL